MTSRETFLNRVRQPLHRAKGAPLSEARPQIDPTVARLLNNDADVTAVFMEQARATGMDVRQVTADGLADAVLALLKEAGAKRIALAAATGSPVAALRSKMETAGMTVATSLDEQFDTDAGITDVRAGIAETGTLVCVTDSDHSRGPSLIPPVHIAVVRASDIVADMFDYFAAVEGQTGQAMPSSTAFITGPSKTADIEGILITGVHGPATVHVLVVGEA